MGTPDMLVRIMTEVHAFKIIRRASQVALVVKNPPDNPGDLRDGSFITGLGRSPGAGHDNPLQYSCLENPHGQQSLVGYSPWGHKELATAERLSRAQEKW